MSLEAVLIVPVKQPLATCAAQVACSHPQRSGESGIRRSIWARSTYEINLYPQLSIQTLKPYFQSHRRFATASALAASSVPALLFARGHYIQSVPEVPLVIDSGAFKTAKTSTAIKLLTTVGAGPEISKSKNTRKLRAGKGKLRGRRYRQRRGPLVIWDPESDNKDIVKTFRNVPGVETSSVYALNLLQLAPGGHLGRFIIWTSSAFAALDKIYGSTTSPAALKKDFLLPSNVMRQPDLAKLINSSEVQSVLRPVKGGKVQKRSITQKKNPLRNKQVLLRLNPYASAFAKSDLGHAKVRDEKPKRVEKEFVGIIHEN